jgi:hypothetical protein
VNAADHNPAMFSEARERKMIFLLCLLAAVHVFIFSATFPFFNIVDEQVHFDLVVRYSNGEIPRVMDAPCAEALSYIAIYGTVEYLWPPESQPGKRIAPPPWTLPMSVIAQNLLDKEAIWKEKVKNHEVAQPPLYYTLAGLWWRSAKALGFHDGFLLYSVRFLNVFFVGALVWLGYLATRLVFPENLFVRLGVPALIAFIPQTAFYSIQNDVLSPLCFGAVFMGLIRFLRAENPGVRLGIFTGLALAATFLTKISNLPLLVVSAVAILFKMWQLARSGNLRIASPCLLALALCAGLPMAAWLVWCKYNFGDFSGTAAKIQFLGWTHKPFAGWWHHPIFTPHGLWTFLSGLISTFWQGEFLWDGKPLALPSAGLVYVLLSIFFVCFALLNPLSQSKTAAAPQRQALWFGFACFAAAVAFLGFLSIIYDFHDCFYPSREHPYFTSGRLMLGALIPFLLLFVYGLDRTLKNFGDTAKFSALAAIILFMLATEITVDWPIFSNPYNWFHM